MVEKVRTTQYLYGIEPEELDYLLYYDALDFKYKKAKELYIKLYTSKRNDKETTDRMFYVLKAQGHTKELIDERSNNE